MVWAMKVGDRRTDRAFIKASTFYVINVVVVWKLKLKSIVYKVFGLVDLMSGFSYMRAIGSPNFEPLSSDKPKPDKAPNETL